MNRRRGATRNSDLQERKQLVETLREHDKRLHLALSASNTALGRRLLAKAV